ncbi:MAG: hypothetical protein ACLVJ6_07960 [Merdibacter sp.]
MQTMRQPSTACSWWKQRRQHADTANTAAAVQAAAFAGMLAVSAAAI